MSRKEDNAHFQLQTTQRLVGRYVFKLRISYRLKSQNHLVQHNKQHDRKDLLNSFHFNLTHFIFFCFFLFSKEWSKDSSHKCNMVEHCDESNLVIKPQKGKALMWYNHKLDGSQRWLGELDPLSYQGSCQVKKGDKWVAKIWININGDGKKELRAWKMGHNWLAENNRNEEIINALKTDIAEETATENRYTKDKNVLNNDEVGVEVSSYINSKDGASLQNNVDTKKENGKNSYYDTQSNKAVTREGLTDSPKTTPEGPKLSRTETSSPLPLTEEQMTPKGPFVGQLPPKEFAGNRIMQSIMLLLEELDQVELEIIARNLHTKLKLVCVPLIVNPMGRL